MEYLDMHTLRQGQEFFFDVVDSTMDTAFSLIHDEMQHGSAVIATHQLQGRGRQGKQWEDVRSENLLTTILLKANRIEEYPKSGYGHCSLRAALAVGRVIEKLLEKTGIVKIKWPNDVFVHDKKIAGILVEARSNWIGIGIGINVGQSSFSPQIQKTATSIVLEQGISVSPRDLFHLVRDELENCLKNTHLAASIRAYLWRYEKDIVVRLPSGTLVRGIHRGITNDGALLIETSQGIQTLYTASLICEYLST